MKDKQEPGHMLIADCELKTKSPTKVASESAQFPLARFPYRTPITHHYIFNLIYCLQCYVIDLFYQIAAEKGLGTDLSGDPDCSARYIKCQRQ